MISMTLRVMNGDCAGQTFHVPPTGATVGRTRVADIILPDGLLSRFHCRFEVAHGATVQDLGSSNGTLVNGAAVDGVVKVLQSGDVVTVGETVLRVELSEGVADAPSPSSAPMPRVRETHSSIDLGLVPDAAEAAMKDSLDAAPAEAAPRRITARRLLLLVLAGLLLAFIALSTFYLLQPASTAPGEVPRALPLASEQPFEFRYENLRITDNALYLYCLTCADTGELVLKVNDLGADDRSFEKQKVLSPNAAQALKKIFLESDYPSIPVMMAESRAVGVAFTRRHLLLALGAEVWERTAENAANARFDRLCASLEEFAKNELEAWAAQYSVEELRELGQSQLNLGLRYWAEQDLSDDRLFLAVTAYQKGLAALDTLNPKPAFVEELRTKLAEAEALLTERYERQLFIVSQAMETKRYGDAAEALRKILRMIPEREDTRNMQATEKLLMIENRYLKKGVRP